MRLNRSSVSVLADVIVSDESTALAERINAAMISQWLEVLSESGKAFLVWRPAINTSHPRMRREMLRVFENPPFLQSLPIWCLLFAAIEASAAFQTDVCPSPQSENMLSGRLIDGLRAACSAWSSRAAASLDRSNARLDLYSVDLSIGGGEQRTGGDFAIVLEFDSSGAQPSLRDTYPSRTVPLVFQAKRYVRPLADVSQNHAVRGYQHSALVRNRCTSAYILYENAPSKEIKDPLPALVKPIKFVDAPGKTNVLENSVDLPSYLLETFHSPSTANAATAEEALVMIDHEIGIDRLAFLAVISNVASVEARYSDALARRRSRPAAPPSTERPADEPRPHR